MIESQVFQGTGAAAGLYAYAYQVAVNPATDGSGQPTHVDSTSFLFNGTPVGTDLTGAGTTSFAYVDQRRPGRRPEPAPGSTRPRPRSPWQPGPDRPGFIRAQYVDPATQTPAARSRAPTARRSSLLSNQPVRDTSVGQRRRRRPRRPTVPVGVLGQRRHDRADPRARAATILAWAGMAGAVALVRRVRKSRHAADRLTTVNGRTSRAGNPPAASIQATARAVRILRASGDRFARGVVR